MIQGRARSADTETKPLAPSMKTMKRSTVAKNGQQHHEKEGHKPDEVADSESGAAPVVRRVLEVEPKPKAGPLPPDVTNTCITSIAGAAMAVHNLEHCSNNEDPHFLSPEKATCCFSAKAVGGGGGSEHATIASHLFQPSFGDYCGSPEARKSPAGQPVVGNKANTPNTSTVTELRDLAGCKKPFIVATATLGHDPAATVTAGCSEKQGFAPHIKHQGCFAPRTWHPPAASSSTINCPGSEAEGNPSSLAEVIPVAASSPLAQLSLSSTTVAADVEATGVSFALALYSVDEGSKTPEAPQATAWPSSLPSRPASYPEAADGSTAQAETSAAGTHPASSPCFYPGAGGSSMPTPSAPWLVQEALSVKAAVDAAVRGASFSSISPQAIDEDSGGGNIAGIINDWAEEARMSASTGALSTIAVKNDSIAEVPRVMADLHAALGRGMSTSEAKAWVQALDRLGEGLDQVDLKETDPVTQLCADDVYYRESAGTEPAVLKSVFCFVPSPPGDIILSPSVASAAPTAPEKPSRVDSSEADPVPSTGVTRRSQEIFLSTSTGSPSASPPVSENVVGQLTPRAEGVGSVVVGAAERVETALTPLYPVGQSLNGDNNNNNEDCRDDRCFSGSSGGSGSSSSRGGEEEGTRKEAVRDDAAAAPCISTQRSTDGCSDTERRTIVAAGPEVNEDGRASSVLLPGAPETVNGSSSANGLKKEEDTEITTALMTDKVDSDASAEGRSSQGGEGGGAEVGSRRRERRNASKFPDDVIGKVPCLCADLNAALGRNVGLQEVKDCVRLLDRSGEGLHRQALLDGCMELLQKGPVRATEHHPLPSAGEFLAASNVRVPVMVNTGDAEQEKEGSKGRGYHRVRPDRDCHGKEQPSRRERGRGTCLDRSSAGDGKRRTASGFSSSDGGVETEKVLASSADQTPAATITSAAGESAAVKESTAPAHPKKRGRSSSSPEPFRQRPGGQSNAGNDGTGGSSCRENQVCGVRDAVGVEATVAGTKKTGSSSSSCSAPSNMSAPRVEVMKTAATAIAALDARLGYGTLMPRRSRGLIPESVIAKVPRLLVDMESALGYRVSLEEAKALCRELDQCGNDLTPNELCDACVCVVLRRTSRRTLRLAADGRRIRRRKKGKEKNKRQCEYKEGRQGRGREKRESAKVEVKKEKKTQMKETKEKPVAVVIAAEARPRSATALPVGDESKTERAVSAGAVCVEALTRGEQVDVGKAYVMKDEGGERGLDVEREKAGVRMKKRSRLEAGNLPESVLSKVLRLVSDLETFVGHPVSAAEAKERCRQLDRGGEGLTQQELCDACVSLMLRSDDHNLGGGGILDSEVTGNDCPPTSPPKNSGNERPRSFQGGRVFGNVQDRGDFVYAENGRCELFAPGDSGRGARDWCPEKMALLLCPARNVTDPATCASSCKDPNGNGEPAKLGQWGPLEVPPQWSPLSDASVELHIPGEGSIGDHEDDAYDSMLSRSMHVQPLGVDRGDDDSDGFLADICIGQTGYRDPDETFESLSRWSGRGGEGLDDGGVGGEIGGGDSYESKTEKVVLTTDMVAVATEPPRYTLTCVPAGVAGHVGHNSGADSTAAASSRRSKGTSKVELRREPLQCEVGEFAVFLTPPDSDSSAPFLVGKILEMRVVAKNHPTTGGRERTEILVHWFMPKKKVTTRATTPTGVGIGSGNGRDASRGVGEEEDGESPTTAADLAVSSYVIGSWSPVYVPCTASKRLVRDTGVEDLAAAMLVFPRLLSSDALPSSVRDAVSCAVVRGRHRRVGVCGVGIVVRESESKRQGSVEKEDAAEAMSDERKRCVLGKPS